MCDDPRLLETLGDLRDSQSTWRTFSGLMFGRITSSLRSFFTHRFLSLDNFSFWLNDLIGVTRKDQPNTFMVNADQLTDLGFSNFDDLVTEMQKLEQAWDNLVTITFDRSEPQRIAVHFAPPVVQLGEQLTIILWEQINFRTKNFADSPAIEPGTYAVERVANPRGDEAPWLVIVGTEVGMPEHVLRYHDKVTFTA